MRCGAALDPGWHGDHILPYIAGGETDVLNGQSLCPICNQKKGASMSMQPWPADKVLRDWQQEALETYLSANKRDFLLVATPTIVATPPPVIVEKAKFERIREKRTRCNVLANKIDALRGLPFGTTNMDLLDQATQTQHGGDRKSEEIKGLNHSFDKKRDRSGQNIRRLRKDFPDLHNQVLTGLKTVTEAAVEAGIYPQRISINTTSAHSAAESIRRNCDQTFIDDLITHLSEAMDD